jgi:toxin ParE1/3/4
MAAWTVRLARQAELDIEGILAWTEVHFGIQQAQSYLEVLTLALEALTEGPDVVGAKQRNDIQPNIRLLHVARHGKRGRHYVVFRVSEKNRIEVLRIIHDSMDLARHLGD